MDPEDYNQMGVSLYYTNTSMERSLGFNIRIDKIKQVRLTTIHFHKLEIKKVLD